MTLSPSFSSRPGLAALAVSALMCCALAATTGCSGGRDLRFTVLFENAKGLGLESPVVYRGLSIGKVRSVGLDQGLVAVAIEVDAEHAAQVCGDASFRIDTSATPSRLEMIRAPGDCVAMVADATVRGSDGRIDDLTRRGKEIYAEQAAKMKEQAERFSRSLEDWSRSPEAEKMRALAETLARDAEELSKVTQEEFDKRWPEIQQRIDDLLGELRDSGHKDEAERLEQDLAK